MSFPRVYDRLIVVCLEVIDGAVGTQFPDESAAQMPQIGRVVAVTREQPLDDGYLSHLDIACGDQVLYSRYAGSEIRLERERYLILREDEVCGIWEGKDAATTSHTVSLSALGELDANSAGSSPYASILAGLISSPILPPAAPPLIGTIPS